MHLSIIHVYSLTEEKKNSCTSGGCFKLLIITHFEECQIHEIPIRNKNIINTSMTQYLSMLKCISHKIWKIVTKGNYFNANLSVLSRINEIHSSTYLNSIGIFIFISFIKIYREYEFLHLFVRFTNECCYNYLPIVLVSQIYKAIFDVRRLKYYF